MRMQHRMLCRSAPGKYAFLSAGMTPVLDLISSAFQLSACLLRLLVLFHIIRQTSAKTLKHDRKSGHNLSATLPGGPEELLHLPTGSEEHHCQRFATMQISAVAGFGHKIGEIVFGILFAF